MLVFQCVGLEHCFLKHHRGSNKNLSNRSFNRKVEQSIRNSCLLYCLMNLVSGKCLSQGTGAYWIHDNMSASFVRVGISGKKPKGSICLKIQLWQCRSSWYLLYFIHFSDHQIVCTGNKWNLLIRLLVSVDTTLWNETKTHFFPDIWQRPI